MKAAIVLCLKTILVFMFFISSCIKQQAIFETETAYPIDKTQVNPLESGMLGDTAYPLDDFIENQEGYYLTTLTIPTPRMETGVVHGKLIALNDDQPYLAPSLYLGLVLEPDNQSEGAPILTSVSIDDDPIAEQALDGTFLFRDVQPGKYGLIFWTPMSVFLVEDEKTGVPVFVDVEAGQAYDLGTIYLP